MALVVKDRVKETTTTTGTGALTLGGAVANFVTFSSVLSDGDTTYYAIVDDSNGAFEVGLGTYASSGTTLTRTTVLASSNSGSAVNLQAGTKNVFITYPADKSVVLDASGNIASVTITSADINGGTIDGTTIGGTTAAVGTFTTANATTVDATNLEVTNLKAKDGTSAGSIADSTGVVTLASSVLTTTDINGGTVDGTTIGGATAAAGTFTTFTSTGIDDNASSTAITIDSSQNVCVGVTTAGTSGLSVATGKNIGFQQSTGEALANMFRQNTSGAFILAQGYQYSGSANGFASSFSGSLAKTAIELSNRISFYVDTAATVAAGTDITPTERMRLESDGDLHVDGDVIAYSTTISDASLKDDVETIDSALDKVNSLRGVTYTWNAGSREGKRDLGVIAQEVEAVIPEIVHEKSMALIDGETYKTVDYEKLTAVLIEAVKELKAEVEALKNDAS